MAAFGEAFVRPPLKVLLYDYLYDLFRLYSPSKQERRVAEYCMDILDAYGFTVWHPPGSFNVYAVRGSTAPGGKFVLLNAHTDTVQKPADRLVEDDVQVIQYSPEMDAFHTNGVAMLGGDDKCGLAIILALATATDLPMKVALTVEEETGCVGVKQIPASFYEDCGFAISLDRKGSRDIIKTYGGRICAPDTVVDELIAVGKEVLNETYATASGSMADTYTIAAHVPCINLSVGYYNAHSSNDFVVVHDTYTSALLVQAAIVHRDRLFAAVARAPVGWQKTQTRTYGDDDWYGGYANYGWYGAVGARDTAATDRVNWKLSSYSKTPATTAAKKPAAAKPTRTILSEFPKKYRGHLKDYADGKIYLRGTAEFLSDRVYEWVERGAITRGEYEWLKTARSKAFTGARAVELTSPRKFDATMPGDPDLDDMKVVDRLIGLFSNGYETVNGIDLQGILSKLLHSFKIADDDYFDALEAHRAAKRAIASKSGWSVTTDKVAPKASGEVKRVGVQKLSRAGFEKLSREAQEEVVFEDLYEWVSNAYDRGDLPSFATVAARAVIYGATADVADDIAGAVLDAIEEVRAEELADLQSGIVDRDPITDSAPGQFDLDEYLLTMCLVETCLEGELPSLVLMRSHADDAGCDATTAVRAIDLAMLTAGDLITDAALELEAVEHPTNSIADCARELLIDRNDYTSYIAAWAFGALDDNDLTGLMVAGVLSDEDVDEIEDAGNLDYLVAHDTSAMEFVTDAIDLGMMHRDSMEACVDHGGYSPSDCSAAIAKILADSALPVIVDFVTGHGWTTDKYIQSIVVDQVVGADVGVVVIDAAVEHVIADIGEKVVKRVGVPQQSQKHQSQDQPPQKRPATIVLVEPKALDGLADHVFEGVVPLCESTPQKPHSADIRGMVDKILDGMTQSPGSGTFAPTTRYQVALRVDRKIEQYYNDRRAALPAPAITPHKITPPPAITPPTKIILPKLTVAQIIYRFAENHMTRAELDAYRKQGTIYPREAQLADIVSHIMLFNEMSNPADVVATLERLGYGKALALGFADLVRKHPNKYERMVVVLRSNSVPGVVDLIRDLREMGHIPATGMLNADARFYVSPAMLTPSSSPPSTPALPAPVSPQAVWDASGIDDDDYAALIQQAYANVNKPTAAKSTSTPSTPTDLVALAKNLVNSQKKASKTASKKAAKTAVAVDAGRKRTSYDDILDRVKKSVEREREENARAHDPEVPEHMIVINRGSTSALTHVRGPITRVEIDNAVASLISPSAVGHWLVYECAKGMKPGSLIAMSALPVKRDVVVVVTGGR